MHVFWLARRGTRYKRDTFASILTLLRSTVPVLEKTFVEGATICWNGQIEIRACIAKDWVLLQRFSPKITSKLDCVSIVPKVVQTEEQINVKKDTLI